MNDTKERILDRGLDRLARNGFAGVTLGLLAQDTGMSKSGLFAHFGSKEEVQLELLEKMGQVGGRTFVEPAMSQPKGLSRLRRIVEGWLGWSEKAGLHGGCPVAAGMFELDDARPDDPVRRKLLKMEAAWRSFLAGLVRQSLKTGELRADLDVDQFVWELCGIYLSHHASYRFIKDPLATERALTAFSALVDRSMNKGRSGKSAPVHRPNR